MTDRRDNTPGLHPDWRVDPHDCPFCEIPGHICGCPEGERIVAANIVLGDN